MKLILDVSLIISSVQFSSVAQSCPTGCNPMNRSVVGFADRDLGTGVDEKKDAGDPSLECNKGALFVAACADIPPYKEALGSKNKVEQKQKQVNNNRHRARRQSIS